MTNLKTMLTASAIALVLASGTSAFAETPKNADVKKAEKHEHKEGDHAHKDDGKHKGHKDGDDHHDDDHGNDKGKEGKPQDKTQGQ